MAHGSSVWSPLIFADDGQEALSGQGSAGPAGRHPRPPVTRVLHHHIVARAPPSSDVEPLLPHRSVSLPALESKQGNIEGNKSSKGYPSPFPRVIFSPKRASQTPSQSDTVFLCISYFSAIQEHTVFIPRPCLILSLYSCSGEVESSIRRHHHSSILNIDHCSRKWKVDFLFPPCHRP